MDSSLKCNRPLFEKDFVRRAEAERLARAVVQPLRDPLDLGLRDRREVVLLREVLPDKPVGVLVEPSLPTRVRMREVEARSEPRRDPLVLGELSAVVRGDRVHLVGEWA